MRCNLPGAPGVGRLPEDLRAGTSSALPLDPPPRTPRAGKSTWGLAWGFLWLAGLSPLQDVPFLLEQGQRLLERGEYAAAARLFSQAVEVKPNDPSTHYYLGVALLSDGKTDKAVQSLEKAASLTEAPHAAVLYQLGTAYLRLERLEESEKMLTRAVALAPREAALRLQLGWVYYKQVEGEKAESEFKKAIEIEPSGLAYYYLGLAEHALGNIEQAAASCRRAIQMKPDMADAYVVLGKCLAQLGRFDEARGALETALQLDPRAAEAHHQLGLMALRSEDLVKALRLFESAVEADPNHQAAWYNLAIVYGRLGREDEARQARARHQQVVRNAQRLKPRPKTPDP